MDEPTDEPTPTAAVPDGPIGGWITPPPARSGRKKIGIVAGLAALVAIAGAKIALGLLAGSVTATALTSMSEGPYDQLPADFRAGIETRIKAIAPVDFEERTDAEQYAWFREQENAGLIRLDDATLTRRFRLRLAGFGQMPVAACAAFVREGAQDGTTSRATQGDFLTALGLDHSKDWFEIAVEAMEAEAHRTPVPRTVTEDEFNRIFEEAGSLARAVIVSATRCMDARRSTESAWSRATESTTERSARMSSRISVRSSRCVIQITPGSTPLIGTPRG